MSRDPRNHPCVDCGHWFGSYGLGPLFPLSATRWRCEKCARASGLFPHFAAADASPVGNAAADPLLSGLDDLLGLAA